LSEPLAEQLGGRAAIELRSGAFLPGRGVLDMKSGLAVGIALLERFAQDPERQGNLLFVATPDEEGGSHGMRSAAAQLPEIAAEWGLDLAAALNLDITVDQADGREGRVIYTGSVGKLLPRRQAAARRPGRRPADPRRDAVRRPERQPDRSRAHPPNRGR